jgi:beta-galactosidase
MNIWSEGQRPSAHRAAEPQTETFARGLLKMKAAALISTLICALLLATSTVAVAYVPPPSPRTKFNFNSGWKVKVMPGNQLGPEAPGFDDSSWMDVTTPYAWNEDDAFRKDIKDLSTGVAWYRKHFKLPRASADQKIFLEFEGIRQGGQFYLNGKLIGASENGVMAFGFDITEQVKPAPQENILAARIDNSWDYREQATNTTFQWNDKNFYANYGGINKNVYLHITDKLYQTLPLYSDLGTTGVYIYAQDFDIKGRSAKVTAESQVRNEYSVAKTFSYEISIEDMSGKVLRTIDGGRHTLAPGKTETLSASAQVDGLNFWSWGYGYLYNVYTILKVDGRPVDLLKTRTGFRKTEFAGGVMKLNDRVIQLKGYAQRTTNEWPAVGLSVPAWMSDFSNRLMVESNGNLVRWMHVTPWKQDVESCDRVGLMEAMPAGDSEKDVEGRRWEQRLEVMRDAIIYNRNNPSIIFYESGNKGVSEDHMRRMKELRDKYDPHGGRASGSREMLDSRVAEYGGEMLYINKSARAPLWAMEYSRDEGLRKYWDEFSPPFHKDGAGPLYNGQDASVYNRNQDSHAIEDVARWYDYWRERPGTGARVSAGGVNIIFSDSNTHHRGAENYRSSGEVDAMRLPKDGYFAHQVMWDGWVDVERARTSIIGHWNYAPGTKKNVYVVSSAEKVELFQNGKSLGMGEQSSRFLFTFKDVQWQPGTVRAVGYDASGRRVSEASKSTAGVPAAIRLTTRTGPKGLRADGADLALVDIEVIDARGRRCPTDLETINFSLAGPALWRGGIAQGPDNFILSKSLPVENGVNRVIIRSTGTAGKIVLSATAAGLKPASVTIVSHPVAVTDGLSLEMPDAGLSSNMERGPTPTGASFTISRELVRIVGVTAGANVETGARSFDDDETTDWSNDGKLSSAWIKYEFEHARSIGEVTLKLPAWRTRSYPIRIMVDDQVVFNGDTPRSLGYVTLAFKPVMGQSLKIELTGSPKEMDAFGKIVELAGQKDVAATGNPNSKATLGIVEIEIYGPVTGGSSK